MRAIKLVTWPNPVVPTERVRHVLGTTPHQKYTIIGSILTDEPFPGIPNFRDGAKDSCMVIEATEAQAWEVLEALAALKTRPAKQQGRDANSYLIELGIQ